MRGPAATRRPSVHHAFMMRRAFVAHAVADSVFRREPAAAVLAGVELRHSRVSSWTGLQRAWTMSKNWPRLLGETMNLLYYGVTPYREGPAVSWRLWPVRTWLPD